MLLMAVDRGADRPPPPGRQTEGRRKALLAYLLRALPAIVWDNIPRGTRFFARISGDPAPRSSIPIAVSASARRSQSQPPRSTCSPATTSAHAAISHREHLPRASKSGPPGRRTRPFLHPDPIGWTEAHRGKILQALYTIMLGNPRLTDKAATPAVTRFKDWWHVCGSAIESAAKEHAAHVKGNVMDGNPECPARGQL